MSVLQDPSHVNQEQDQQVIIIIIRSLQNAARYEPAFSRDLSNKLKDFLLCIGVEVKKWGKSGRI